MARAFVKDINKVKQFLGDLESFKKDLERNRKQLEADFKEVGQTWNDDQRMMFEKALNQTYVELDYVLKQLKEKYIPYTGEVIRRDEEYLRKRM